MNPRVARWVPALAAAAVAVAALGAMGASLLGQRTHADAPRPSETARAQRPAKKQTVKFAPRAQVLKQQARGEPQRRWELP